MKIALYRTAIGSHSWVWARECISASSDDVQVSEAVEVEFPPLSDDVVIAAQLKALDTQEAAIRKNFQIELNKLNDERQRIQALPNLTEK